MYWKGGIRKRIRGDVLGKRHGMDEAQWKELGCHAWEDRFELYLLRPGEGNGTPLQYSCLENPRDGGAW